MKLYDKKITGGILQIVWACPHENKNGQECGKLHWVNWDSKFDSCEDGIELYCEKHYKNHLA